MAKTKLLTTPNVFPISIDGRRTSFSLDYYLAELLAIYFKEEPNSKEAHRAVTKYLPRKFFAWQAFDPFLPISRQARRMALASIVHPSLVEAHEDWSMAK